MKCYLYTAITLEGNRVKGEKLAENQSKLGSKLKEEGYFLIYSSAISKEKKSTLWRNKLNSKEVALLNKELYLTLHAGIPLPEALLLLAEQAQKPMIKNSLYKIGHEVEKGVEVSEAMESFVSLYPPFMIHMLRIGEQSGKVEEILQQLTTYYERQHRIQTKFKNSMIYPLLVFICCVFIIGFILVKIIPTFTLLLTSLGTELPYFTKQIVEISNFLFLHVILINGVILTIILFIFYFYRTEKGKELFHGLSLKLPFIKTIIKVKVSIQLSTGMYLLISAGISFIKALEIMEKFIQNRAVQIRITNAIKDIRLGESIVEALTKINIFPPIFLSMIKVGEEAGVFEEIFERAAILFQEELDEKIEKLLTLLGPLLLMLLALFVGSIIFSVMLPMFKVMDSI